LHELVVHSRIAQEIDSRADDYGCGITVAEIVDLPDEFRAAGGPLLEETALL
jgi:hypothetical protein